jgi:hypothetical protein
MSVSVSTGEAVGSYDAGARLDEGTCRPRSIDLGSELKLVFGSLASEIEKGIKDGYSVYSAPAALAGLCLLADSLQGSLTRAPLSSSSSSKQVFSESKISKIRAAHDLVLSLGAAVIDRVPQGSASMGMSQIQELISATQEMLLRYSDVWGWLNGRTVDGNRVCGRFAHSCLELEFCFASLSDDFGTTALEAPWKKTFTKLRQLQHSYK